MADRKRKGTAAVTAPPAKKSRTNKSTSIEGDSATTAHTAHVREEAPQKPGKARLGRKRAADFLGEDDEPTNTLPTADNGSKKARPESLTVDGANALVEHATDAQPELVTTAQPTSSSMLAEAQRTVDKEIEDELGIPGQGGEAGEGEHEDDEEEEEEEIDEAPALLTGFDSDDEDLAEDKGLDRTRTAPIPQYKKTQKKLRKAAEAGSADGPGTVYIGRIPHGFYEKQMRDYFSQFGDITKLRLSRNKRTGASKHFAFVEFASMEVAKIVAETMDNYLMFGHILKCKFAPQDTLHPEVWKGANRRYRRIPHAKIEKLKLEEPKTAEQWQKKIDKKQKKMSKKAEQLKALGYDYNPPALANPMAVVEQRKLEEAEQKALTQSGQDAPATTGGDVSITGEEVASSKLSKKAKHGKAETPAQVQPLTEVNLAAKDQNISPEEAAVQKDQEQETKEHMDEKTDARTNVRTTIPSSRPIDDVDDKLAASKKPLRADKKAKSAKRPDKASDSIAESQRQPTDATKIVPSDTATADLPAEDKIVLAANRKSAGRGHKGSESVAPANGEAQSRKKTAAVTSELPSPNISRPSKAKSGKRETDGMPELKGILKKSKKA